MENPNKCEVCGVKICFWVKNHLAAKIYRELYVVYGPKILSEGVVRQWVQFFKNGRTNIYYEEASDKPYKFCVSDDLLNKVKSLWEPSLHNWNFPIIFLKFLGVFYMR